MSYRVIKGEELSAALERIAQEEFRDALALLVQRNQPEAIHEVRKTIKRIRALLRCLRVALPESFFQRENRRLGDAGRKVSAPRDLQVQLRVLSQIKAASQSAGRAVRREMLQRQARLQREMPSLRRALRQVLRQSGQTVRGWPLRRANPVAVTASLSDSYRRARRCCRAACRNPTPENLHDCRKTVKSLGYGFELFEDILPRKFAKMTRSCDELAENLGDNHDLFLVLESLRREHEANPTDEYATLARRIDKRRAKLARRAFKIGRPLFRQKPAAFARRLQKLLCRRVG